MIHGKAGTGPVHCFSWQWWFPAGKPLSGLAVQMRP